MLLPNKALSVVDSEIYKALDFYKSLLNGSVSSRIKSIEHLKWIVILYALKYIKVEGDIIVKIY